MNVSDTICAISTPRGVGGIAVARVSGPCAIKIVDSIWRGKRLADVLSHTAHLGLIVDSDGSTLDQAVATVFKAPKSFTGDDVVELSVHGSEWVQRQLINRLIGAGARLAEAGEFTRRAFLSGHLDLAQAEAVADVIASSSRAAHHVAMSQMKGDFSKRLAAMRDQLLELASLLELELDFSEEDVEFASREKLLTLARDIYAETSRLAATFATGQAIKEGIPVAIVGATNAGKSTLLNRLLHEDRAIVSDVHGTTRDVIEDTVELDGVRFRFVDTAGLRSTTDKVEALGIERTISKLVQASIVLWVIDGTATNEVTKEAWQRIAVSMHPGQRIIALINKVDMMHDATLECVSRQISVLLPKGCKMLTMSARDGDMSAIEAAIIEASGASDIRQGDILVTNERHYQALAHATQSISRVIEALELNLSGDLVAQDIRETLLHLGEITGTITTDEILSTIFSRFCVGK